MNLFLIKYIRHMVLTASFITAVVVYIILSLTFADTSLRIIRLVEIYAFCAVIMLYLAMLASPLYAVFPNFPFRPYYIKARRAIGNSAFFFGLTHGTLAFFMLLGGFSGLGFLAPQYLLAIILSFTALLILTLMAATSFDYMVQKLGTKWKKLHRFVYIAGLLVIIHTFLIGTHFQDLSGWIPQLFIGALVFLLLLESIRFDRFISNKFLGLPRYGIVFVLCVVAMAAAISYLYFPQGSGTPTLGIHAAHIQLAKQAQNTTANQPSTNIPGLNCDRTKRYTVSFNNPPNVQPNQDVTLTFTVYDASSGNPVTFFTPIYEKVMHLVIVNNDLTYFTHIHPTQNGATFSITTKFPTDGVYHLYIDFQPLGAIEQQIGFTLPVGNTANVQPPSMPADTSLTKNFGNYQVTLSKPNPLKAANISIGEQTLTFTIKDAKTGQPITTLKPYLAAYGHLSMINQQTFDFIHVHPSNLTPPAPNANGGPNVTFLPLGLYGPIKPGVYTIFAEFNPDGNLFTATFTVEVQ